MGVRDGISFKCLTTLKDRVETIVVALCAGVDERSGDVHRLGTGDLAKRLDTLLDALQGSRRALRLEFPEYDVNDF